MPTPRFGHIGTPIEFAPNAEDGEILVGRQTGHFYIKKGTAVLSKSVENEDRLNVLDNTLPYSRTHFLMGNNDWSHMIHFVSGDPLTYNYANGGMTLKCTGSNGTTFDIKSLFHVSSSSKYYVSITLALVSGGTGKLSLGVTQYTDIDPINPITSSNVMLASDVTIDGNSATISGIISGNAYVNNSSDPNISKLLANATYFKPFIKFGHLMAASSTQIAISRIEVFEIPQYFDISKGLKSLYFDVDASDSRMSGTKIADDPTTSGKAVTATCNAGETKEITRVTTRALKYSSYSLLTRLRLSNFVATANGNVRILVTGVRPDSSVVTFADKLLPLSKLSDKKYKNIFVGFIYGEKIKDDEITITYTIKDTTTQQTVCIDYLCIMPSVVASVTL